MQIRPSASKEAAIARWNLRATDDQLCVIDQLRAEVEALRGLVGECAEYLNTDRETTIGNGSILHRKMIDAAMAAKEGEL